jgi:hypothetical protein
MYANVTLPSITMRLIVSWGDVAELCEPAKRKWGKRFQIHHTCPLPQTARKTLNLFRYFTFFTSSFISSPLVVT